ncbi:MAG: hypothetical protein MSA09_16440 [Lachnospiraceae bacterium]|nr:hypothetical protein [Lachnospiraceae bacterium]
MSANWLEWKNAILDIASSNVELSRPGARLHSYKENVKYDIKVAVIGTVIVALLCVGVMYLRFRIFGG